MDSEISWERLAMYFADELNREEMMQMEAWINADSERREKFNYLEKIWKQSGELPYELNEDKAWKTLVKEINKVEKFPGVINKSDTNRKKVKNAPKFRKVLKTSSKAGETVRRILLVAASVLIILTSGYLTHDRYMVNQETESIDELAVKEFITSDGEKATYKLSDGSRVILHAGSRLEVPVNFNKESRDIFLDGEAYFEVTHDPEKPFIVNSEKAYTRVLGTKFLVQAWSKKGRNLEVIVEEGRVAMGVKKSLLSEDQQEVTVSRNQKGLLTSNQDFSVTEVTDISWYLGWIEGRLISKDRQLGEILPLLEQWYAVNIKTEDKEILKRKLTAEINYSQPMMEVLKGIALSLDLKVVKEDRTITFHMS